MTAHEGSDRTALIGILAYEGVDELDLVSVLVPLTKVAASQSPCFPIRPVLIGSGSKVRGSNGLTFEVTAGIAELARCDAAVIPGGAGVHVLHEDARLSKQLIALVERQAAVYTICSGVFVLARLGLLGGLRFAVHAQKRDALAGLVSAEQIGSGFIRDGFLRSIGGSSAQSYVKGLEMAYQILNEFCPQAIDYVAARLETRPSLDLANVNLPMLERDRKEREAIPG
jgi:transcriptional regulator GlxA family with amidase domain